MTSPAERDTGETQKHATQKEVDICHVPKRKSDSPSSRLLRETKPKLKKD
jgi:hypothetical protein